MQKADQESIQIIKNTEDRARIMEQSLQKKAEDRQKELLHQLEQGYKKQQEEARQTVFNEAMELVKKTIIKTVELDPKDIDEALIKKAVLQIKEEN